MLALLRFLLELNPKKCGEFPFSKQKELELDNNPRALVHQQSETQYFAIGK